MKNQNDLQFDTAALKRIKAREMNHLIKMTDLDNVAETLAKYVTVCPAEWGNPKDAATWLELPLRGESPSLQGVIEALAAVLRDAVRGV